MHFVPKPFPRQGSWGVDKEGHLGILFIHAAEVWVQDPKAPDDPSKKVYAGQKFTEEFHIVNPEDGQTSIITRTPWSELTQATATQITSVKDLSGKGKRVHPEIPEETLVTRLGYSA